MTRARPSAELVQIPLAEGADEDGFRLAVRRLIAAAIPPEHVTWTSDTPSLFGTALPTDGPHFALPRAAGDLVHLVHCHRDPERHALLYRLIWRLRHGEPGLLSNPADPLVHRLTQLAKAVRRDLHKMHAFLRFRRTLSAERPRAFCRVVRARALHPRRDGAASSSTASAALHVVDPDAAGLAALERRDARPRSRRLPRRRAEERRLRGRLARLL
jgi:hypothetical protein